MRIQFNRVRLIGSLILSFTFLFVVVSCQWGSTDAGPGPTAPSLKVTSTYPANGTVGPFDLYTPRPDSVKPHFYVHFNTPVNASTVNATTVTCTGFSDPESVKVVSHIQKGSEDVFGFQVMKKGGTGSPAVPLPYQIGAAYGVTIDSTVKSMRGAVLGRTYRFSFTPEPYFRVVGFSFHDGDTIIPRSVEIFFNSKIGQSILAAVSTSPMLNDSMSINSVDDSTSVVFDAYGRVTPSTTYSVSVAQNATDGDGNLINAAVENSFFAPPLVVSHNQFSLTNANLATQIVFSFNYPMNVNSVNSAFSLSPSLPITVSTGTNQLSFYAVNDFAPNSDYTASMSAQATTLSGSQLSSPVSLSFHTASFGVSHQPGDGARNVSTHDIIEFDFSGAVNTSTVAGAITVSPPFAHQLKFSADTPNKFIYAYYVPTNILSSNTTYQVIIANTVQSIGGYTLAQPDTFSFTTGYSE